MTLTRLLRIWRHRVTSIAYRGALDEATARELTFHFDQLVAEHIASG